MLKSFFAFAKVWWERSYRAETSEDDGSPFSSLEVEFVRIPHRLLFARDWIRVPPLVVQWPFRASASENYMKPASFSLFPVFSVFWKIGYVLSAKKDKKDLLP